jgi:hypothetical protein
VKDGEAQEGVLRYARHHLLAGVAYVLVDGMLASYEMSLPEAKWPSVFNGNDKVLYTYSTTNDSYLAVYDVKTDRHRLYDKPPINPGLLAALPPTGSGSPFRSRSAEPATSVSPS